MDGSISSSANEYLSSGSILPGETQTVESKEHQVNTANAIAFVSQSALEKMSADYSCPKNPLSVKMTQTRTLTDNSIMKNKVDLVSFLQNQTLEFLIEFRNKMGILVHKVLSNQVISSLANKTPPPKLLLVNAVAAGKDTCSVASNDGSSRYLCGGIVNYGEDPSKVLAEDPRELAKSKFDFWDRAGIGNYTLVAGGDGYASGEQAGQFVVYAGKRDHIISREIHAELGTKSGSPEDRAALQEIAAIETLHILLEVLDPELDIINELDDLRVENIIDDKLLNQADQIETLNHEIWKEIKEIIDVPSEDGTRQKISIGESFTSGILADLLTTLEGSSSNIDISLNWYDSKLKEYVGVPSRNVEWDLIAEPSTIAIASSGLLKIAPESTSIVLGTTGYANYWVKGEPDYFSIGVVDRANPHEVSTAKVLVTSTKDEPTSRGRRQLTRQLGATTALFMLASSLEKHYSNQKIKIIKDRLENIIMQHGSISLQNWNVTEGKASKLTFEHSSYPDAQTDLS